MKLPSRTLHNYKMIDVFYLLVVLIVMLKVFCLFFRIKEKFPYAFDDICLYSEVSHLLAHCMFRLTSRRFIQELFQDVQFMAVRDQTILCTLSESDS